MEGLIPAPQCLQLAGKGEWQVAEAAAVLSVWEQTLMYSAVRGAAAVAGQLKKQQQQQQQVKAALGEEVVLVVA